MTAPDLTIRRFLVPELDGELLTRTAPVEELLLILTAWSDEDHDLESAAPWASAGARAVGDLRVRLQRAPYRSLNGPDARYEHEPLPVIALPAATLDDLGAAVTELARAVHSSVAGPVTEAVEEFAAECWPINYGSGAGRDSRPPARRLQSPLRRRSGADRGATGARRWPRRPGRSGPGGGGGVPACAGPAGRHVACL